jgi:hypothetical protein
MSSRIERRSGRSKIDAWQSASARSVGARTLSYVQTATKSGCDGSCGQRLDPDQSIVTSQSAQI